MSTILKLDKKAFNDAYINTLFDYEKRIQIYYGGA
jgi:hypothetical protein